MARYFLSILTCFLLLTGCAKTTVVLLPDESGTVGQVVVQAGNEQRILSQADERVEAASGTISSPSHMTPAAITRTFGSTLQALPEKPESILIYFTSESTRPTAESLQQLPRVVESLTARSVPSVNLFGHTDHLGDRSYNQELSDERAKEVRRLLIRQGIAPDSIEIRGFGDRDPLFPPRVGKAEPRNRRVEIFIR